MFGGMRLGCTTSSWGGYHRIMKYPELEETHKHQQVQILMVMGKVFHFTSVSVICPSENCSASLLGFLFSLSCVDGTCSDLQDEGGSFLDKFKKGFMQNLLGLYLLEGDTGEPDRGGRSCVSVCICCGLWDWREGLALVWAPLGSFSNGRQSCWISLWGLEIFYFLPKMLSFGTLFLVLYFFSDFSL